MLRSLSVRNFAIIDRLNLEFGEGFNVLTGETGAGKSILMDALNLLLGGRAGAEMVRGGTDRAILDAVFDVSASPEVGKLVQELGYDVEEGELFLSREVTAAGKSTCRIGGRPAAVAQLKEIGEWLVDLHGQHEHQSLLVVARHLDILDTWGGKRLEALRGEVAETYQTLQRLRREQENLERDARERAHLLDLYAFQVKEITGANLVPDEDTELATEHRRLANAQRLAALAAGATEALGSSGGVVEALSTAVKVLEEAAHLDETLTPTLDSIRSAYYELTEAERDLSRYQDSIEYNPERLAQIEERLEQLRTLKRKYGDSIAEIVAYGEETAAKLEALAHSEERGATLESEIAQTTCQLQERCAALSQLRRQAASEFQEVTLAELRDLAMEKARFEVQVTAQEPTAKGADRVEFLIATNPGEPLRPLAKVASGGEISRVMLAIKTAMARQEALPTMVFDEVDVGVGGRTASRIAEKIATLAQSAQVFCITHLAPIASRGQHHYYIEKVVTGDRTSVTVTPLDAEQRITEIARMIGGTEVTETVLQHAREMLDAGAK